MLKAAKELDEEGAEYPKKIAFYNPPDLALEALEVGTLFRAVKLPTDIRLI